MRIVIVGAGIAGLTAGRILHRAGCDITVYETSDGIGGRVRSDQLRGFTLDRGFQVLFTAYPAAMRQLDYASLNLRAFDPGAIIAFAAERHILADPLRDPFLTSLGVTCLRCQPGRQTANRASRYRN